MTEAVLEAAVAAQTTEASITESSLLRAAIIEGIVGEEDLVNAKIRLVEEKTTESVAPILVPKEHVQAAVFTPDAVKVVFSTGQEKHIAYRDFIQALSESLNEETTLTEGMPFNLPSNVFYFAAGVASINMNMYYPAKVSKLKFQDPSTGKVVEFDIVMPNLILAISLKPGNTKNSWRVTSSKYFCTDLPVNKLPKTFINFVSATQRVFLLPMSNTYTEGHMCFGNNSMPVNFAENNLRGLDWYYQYLWESPFNTDLGIRAVPGMEVKAWYNLLKKAAAENQPFPYDRLHGWTPL